MEYMKDDPNSIEAYAKRMIGRSLRDILDEKECDAVESGNSKAKGEMGQLIEKFYFNYEPNNKSEPDFPKAGLELKTTPLKKISKGNIRAKERLVLNIINYMGECDFGWENSSFWKKNKRLLLMFYLFEENKSLLDFIYMLAGIWDYPREDLLIMMNDYQTIIRKIKQGIAHEISEGDTMYLAACIKGQGGKRDIRAQPYSEILAPQRAFSLKQKYMNIIIEKWLFEKELLELEPVIKSANELEGRTFDEIVYRKFQPYIGMKVDEIRQRLGLDINPKAKNYYATLSLRILGVQTMKAEEFEKADITIKTIRVDRNNMPKEDISFPYFKYKEIVNEDWDTSTLRSYLERRFFFVVYKYDKVKDLFLYGVKFWAMPIADIDGEVQRVWNKTVHSIKEERASYLPKKAQSPICHVRPHGKNKKDIIETPNGEFLVKKSFWLNRDYIKCQIVDSMSEITNL